MYNVLYCKDLILPKDMLETTTIPTCTTQQRACVAKTAQIISSKWTPQLLYSIANGSSRFCELQKEAGGINPRTLSARLDELEQAGIVAKESYAEVPPRTEYTLTKKGKDLVPILEQMVAWGNKYSDGSDER